MIGVSINNSGIINHQTEYSYIVFKDGTMTNAKNGITDAIDYSGIDAATVIQCAINALTSGGKIFVKRTTYSGSKYVTLKANTELIAEQGTIFSGLCVHIDGADYTTVKNITFTGSSITHPIRINNSNYVKIKNCRGDNLGSGSNTCFRVNIPDFTTMTNIIFEDCIVTDGQRFGFYIAGNYVNSAKLKDSTFINCMVLRAGKVARVNDWTTGYDISEQPNLENVKFINCVARECWESGFHTEYTSEKKGLAFINCISEDNGQKPAPDYGAGFLANSGGGELQYIGCISRNNRGPGIQVGNVNNTDVQIIGCISEGNTGRNIEIVDAYRSIISNNIVKNGSLSGIYVVAKYSVISNNVITNPGQNGIGIANYTSDCIIKGNYISLDTTHNGIFIQTTGLRLIISDNRIEGGANGIYIEPGGSGGNNLITNNAILNAVSNSIFIGNNNNYVFGNYVNKTFTNTGTGNIINNNIGYLTENSGSEIGTGSQQTIPHGLATVPTKIILTNKSATANAYISANANVTNIYVTATLNQGYLWKAET